MTTTYDQFKDYLIVHLWKVGDSVVIDNLDALIKTANAELNRVLKVIDRDVSMSLSITALNTALPSDFRSMRDLFLTGVGQMTYITPQQLLLDRETCDDTLLSGYSTQAGELLVTGGVSASSPVTGTMNYYANIPDYKTTGVSWVADNYYDVYLYCVLKHTAPFLREDERLAMWSGMYGSAMESVMDENEDRKYSGGPLNVTFPYSR